MDEEQRYLYIVVYVGHYIEQVHNQAFTDLDEAKRKRQELSDYACDIMRVNLDTLEVEETFDWGWDERKVRQRAQRQAWEQMKVAE